MAKSSNKWYLFYILYNAYRQRDEIMARTFDSELDMLIFWSKNPRTKSINMHHVVSPDGLTKVPNDLYERIDVLRRELVEQEKKIEKKEELSERDKRLQYAKASATRRQNKKQQEQQEASCTQ